MELLRLSSITRRSEKMASESEDSRGDKTGRDDTTGTRAVEKINTAP